MSSPRIPGPRQRTLTTLRVGRQPALWFPRWRAAYGPVFHLPTHLGEMCILARAEFVRALFGASPDRFTLIETSALDVIFGARSVVNTLGQEHRRQRKLLMPSFQGHRARALGSAIAGVAHQHVRSLAPGQSLTARGLGLSIGLEVILRAVYGINGADRLAEHRNLIRASVDALHPSFVFVRSLCRPWFPPFRSYLARAQAWALALSREVETRRVQHEAGAGTDILSLMLDARYVDDGGEEHRLAHEEIIDQLRTLLFAGHETFASIFAWSLDCILRHPEVREAIEAELSEVAVDGEGRLDTTAVLGLKQLSWAIDEVMRMHPVISSITRLLKEPYEVGGYTIPAGWNVAASLQLVHRDPDLYPEPHLFRPQRFEDRRYAPHEYFPFGGGHRRCLGATLASMELRIAVATCLYHGAWSVPAEQPRERRIGATLAPHNGAPITLVRHRVVARSGHAAASTYV